MPTLARETLLLRLWAWRSIPLLWWVRPTLVEASETRCVVKVPLSRRTRNHLGSMYFGALCIGADTAAAYLALKAGARQSGWSILFKDLRAEFVKRPEGDVHFECAQGEEIRALLSRAEGSGERESLPLSVVATVPSKLGNEPVATFSLTLSVKRRGVAPP